MGAAEFSQPESPRRFASRGRTNAFPLVLALTIAALLLTVYVGVSASAARRAYVSAEGRASSERKTGLQDLIRYAFSHDERDYDRYLVAQRVPAANRRAWLALR